MTMPNFIEPQPIMIGYITLSAVLFWLGGFGKIPPGKSWRRHILPVFCIGLLLLLGVIWWRAVLSQVVKVGVNTNGYGEDDPLWKRILTLAGLGIPAIVIDPTVWIFAPIYTLAVFGSHYILSKKINRFSWPFAEFMAGASQGIADMVATLKP